MILSSDPGTLASICQLPSAIRLGVKTTRGDLLITRVCPVDCQHSTPEDCHNQAARHRNCQPEALMAFIPGPGEWVDLAGALLNGLSADKGQRPGGDAETIICGSVAKANPEL